MRSPKRTLLAVLIAAAFALISFEMAAPPAPPPDGGGYDQSSFERFPPIPTNFWVQKLATPIGDTNMIMWIRYISDTVLPPLITVFVNGDSIIFHDDGLGPDTLGSDGVYAAYLHENIPAFLSEEAALETNLAEQGSFTTFNGHFARLDTATHTFDVVSFNNNTIVPFDGGLINGANCTSDLLPQNSLFITDLSVVEDGARTYNVAVDTGNPYGVWTFGNLIRNIVNDTTTDSTRGFLKTWVNNYMNTHIINGDTVMARVDAYTFLIGPWLKKANAHTSLFSSGTHDITTWQSDWNNTPEDSIVIYAPFKLLAIVNRLDLRGNNGYRSFIAMAGETRFIYTLIAPVDISIDPEASGDVTYTIPKGTVPIQIRNNFKNDPTFLDWRGMNVILEYGNPQIMTCILQQYAQAWLDLSSLALGSSDYKDSLEAITHTVIDAGAGEGNGKATLNGSALNRLRSNERIFFKTDATTHNIPSWSQSDWQLSQFELDATTRQFKPVPVANTPQYQALTQTNIVADVDNPATTDTSVSIALINWAYCNKNRLAAGNHQIPFTFSISGRTMQLAGTANMFNEQGHFWDLYWDAPTSDYYSTIGSGTTDTFARTLRRQLSLNTCQGCHGGETKTLFTQIRPVGYGVSENYWSTTHPESETGHVDLRFIQNTGTSEWNGSLAPVYDLIAPSSTFPVATVHQQNYGDTTTTITVPDVSAFLTGRVYHGGSGLSAYADDNYNSAENSSDSVFGQGYYFVYDPADVHDGTGDHTRPNPDNVFGFNDLLLRKNSMCQFINVNCNDASTIIGVVTVTQHIPLAE